MNITRGIPTLGAKDGALPVFSSAFFCLSKSSSIFRC